tara:strand:+ start:164 stop:1051 length:888 start_codon:yes stop_codon:yes gene_type:complete
MSISDTEETYQLFKNTIHSNGHNKGEKEEALFLGNLYYWNETRKYHELVKIFGDEAEEGLVLINMETGDIINNLYEIKKAKSTFKADCIIKFNKTGRQINPSIKSCKSASCSVINHTPRSARQFQKGGDLHGLLAVTDTSIKIYINQRKKGAPEDIKLDKLSLDKIQKNSMYKLIIYFMFKGTGCKLSDNPADSILLIKEDTMEFIPLYSDEDKLNYIQKNYNKFVISLRGKGMPKEIKFKIEAETLCTSDILYKEKYELARPWIHETTECKNKTKKNPLNKVFINGSLHMRMKK